MMKTAIYPGTFDPITNGHLDIIKRASRLFDLIVVAVSDNPRKEPFFSLDERKRLVQETVVNLDNIEVDIFSGLLVRYAKSKNATVLIRGLRAVSDFEYEFQMALMNRKLIPEIETVYLMPSEEYTYINSTIVKEVAMLSGKIDCFLPPVVAAALKEKMRKMRNSLNIEGK